MTDEIEIIRKFIKILETKLRFKGSPKGGGTSSPYYEKASKPLLGKSEYDVPEELSDEESKDQEVEISNHFNKKKDNHDDTK